MAENFTEAMKERKCVYVCVLLKEKCHLLNKLEKCKGQKSKRLGKRARANNIPVRQRIWEGKKRRKKVKRPMSGGS